MTIESIEQQVVLTLQTIPAIKKVYDHEPSKLGSLPAVTMYFDGFDQEEGTTHRKAVTWRWTIRLYVPVMNEEKAQASIKQLVQSIIYTLAENPGLDGTVLSQNVTTGEVYVARDQNSTHLIAEMTLEAEVEYSIY